MKKPHGNILLLTILLVIPLMLIVTGLAVDVGMLFSTRSELHRAMDAAALAGAGKLQFDNTVFSTARQYAHDYAAANPYLKTLPISLGLNASNSLSGDIVLGVWSGSSFSVWDQIADPNGTTVNAVQCRTAQPIPTYFLKMIGLPSLSTSALSIAVSNPPNKLPPNTCYFPIGVTDCSFKNNGIFNSAGCGTTVTFATSNTKLPCASNTNSGCCVNGEDVCVANSSNTAAWVDPTNANNSNLSAAVAAANTQTGCNPNSIVVPTPLDANNGVFANVERDIFNPNNNTGYFLQHYDPQVLHCVEGPDGTKDNCDAYNGPGWEVFVPVLNTPACPPGPINGNFLTSTFSRFVITQVISKGECAVNNDKDPRSFPYCQKLADPTLDPKFKDPNVFAMFGYFDCKPMDTTPTGPPGPKTAVSEKLRLVQ
jgi:putative Flp pilus-assembly TadE/G-like protein